MFSNVALSLGRAFRRIGLAAALAVCVGSTAKADLISFNPTGGATTSGGFNPGTFTISSLQFAAGDALAKGAIVGGGGFTVGQTFQLYYQTVLTGVNSPGGPISLAGLNTANGYQITEVSTFTERVTSFNAATATATFALAGGPNTTTIYFADLGAGATKADFTTGAGFTSGTAILTKTVVVNDSNFQDTTRFGSTPGTTALNKSGGGDFLTTTTDQGTGSTSLTLAVTPGYNANFFRTAGLAGSFFSANQKTPFTEIAPSTSFFGGTITPVVGANNGTSGPDFLLQISGASESFAVPEPASVVMTLLGFAGVGAGSVISRRRRAQA